MTNVQLTPTRDGIVIDGAAITFKRTVRIADDGKVHALPPDLGNFPVRRVADYADRVPAEWLKHGGVFLPMHEREALWMSFASTGAHALKVGLGMVNAVTGKPWSDALDGSEQDYMVLPRQPWLDGIKAEDGAIRQFVAMPLGGGHTVEGQLSGEERYGGLQILSCPIKPGIIPANPWSSDVAAAGSLMPKSLGFAPYSAEACFAEPAMAMDMVDECAGFGAPAPVAHTHSLRRSRSSRPFSKQANMGMGAGGLMRQEIYKDTYGVDSWDQDKAARVFVHLCNAQQWQAITGEQPHSTVTDHSSYHGQWFDVVDHGIPSVPGSQILDSVSTVDEIDAAKAEASAQAAAEAARIAAKKAKRKARAAARIAQEKADKAAQARPPQPPATIIVNPNRPRT